MASSTQKLPVTDEKIMEVSRSVQYNPKNNSHYMNVPQQACDIIGISKGDDADIAIFQDGVFVQFTEDAKRE